MVYLKCAAACGDFDLCLIACPHNAQLDGDVVPICDCDRAGLTGDDEKIKVVVEEKTSEVET